MAGRSWKSVVSNVTGQLDSERAKVWRVFNTSELFQAESEEKNGYFIFPISKLEGKEGKKKLTTFLIYIRSNGREDLTSHNTFGIVFITEITLLIVSTN